MFLGHPYTETSDSIARSLDPPSESWEEFHPVTVPRVPYGDRDLSNGVGCRQKTHASMDAAWAYDSIANDGDPGLSSQSMAAQIMFLHRGTLISPHSALRAADRNTTPLPPAQGSLTLALHHLSS